MGVERHEELLDSLERLAASVAVDHGVELVELSMRGSGSRRLLRVDIDRAGPLGINVDDCQRVSHALSQALDEEDLMAARYVLEVSSSGVDRPIVTADDYRRNVGRNVLIVATPNGAERQRCRGELLGLRDGSVHLRTAAGHEIEVPLSGVVEARQDVAF